MAMITIHRDLGVTAITALWDSIDLLLDPLLGSVDSSLKPAFLPVHHVDCVGVQSAETKTSTDE